MEKIKSVEKIIQIEEGGVLVVSCKGANLKVALFLFDLFTDQGLLVQFRDAAVEMEFAFRSKSKNNFKILAVNSLVFLIGPWL